MSSVKIKINGWLAVIAAVLLLYATNPDEHAHRQTMVDAISGGNVVVDAVGTIAAKHMVVVSDYYLFSIGRIRVDGVRVNATIGILNQVFIISKNVEA